MSDLDDLFARIDADPTIVAPADIDAVVAWYRQQRAAKASGNFKRAKKETGPEVKLNLAELGLAQPAAGVRRRV